jgi:hypothetical protein
VWVGGGEAGCRTTWQDGSSPLGEVEPWCGHRCGATWRHRSSPLGEAELECAYMQGATWWHGSPPLVEAVSRELVRMQGHVVERNPSLGEVEPDLECAHGHGAM